MLRVQVGGLVILRQPAGWREDRLGGFKYWWTALSMKYELSMSRLLLTTMLSWLAVQYLFVTHLPVCCCIDEQGVKGIQQPADH